MKFDFSNVVPEYHKEFTDRPSVEREFGIQLSNDYEILFAYYSYDYEDWSGQAIVFGYDNVAKEYFEVYGSHCSCHGLSSSNYDCNQDTQWEPEYVHSDILNEWLTKKATSCYHDDSADRAYMNFLLKYVVKE